ncbi:hypothetical protein FHX41_4908 [Actinomadura hallensis]|uniref:Uncharacterized protein n=1 Tax=Actinomadura hallensis TaxID=337895 RepID=A0A543IKR2_9ACTN|nr:HEPN domain-containing protein [Actinomadura hallensis]TQM71156.1 hypothetical protein FHX41_4908 [Actinomadura hallensis]
MTREIDAQTPISGVFWLQSERKVVPGLITLAPRWPKLELFGSLTDAYEVTSRGPNFVTRQPSRDGGEELTIHGNLEGGRTFSGWPRRVTLIRSNTRRRLVQMFGVGPEKQVFEGSYALLGGHIEDAHSIFTAARMRVQNIDEWTALPGLERTIGRNRASLSFSRPDIPSVALDSHFGRLTLQPRHSIAFSGATEAGIKLSTWLEFRFDGGYTVDALRSKFLLPLSTLLTILYGVECQPTDLEVFDEGNRTWLKVFAYEISSATCGKSEDPLLTYRDIGLEKLAAWFTIFDRLAPIPRILAGVIADKDRAVENRLMELAMAAEGLHRRLHPGSRRLSEDRVTESISILKNSSLAADVSDIISNALRTHLWDLSFPVRIKELTEEVAAAAPGVCGKSNRWKAAVVNARNGFAHSLPGELADSHQIFAYNSLAASLRWLLTARILQEVGLDDNLISSALTSHDKYQSFLSRAKGVLPKIYSE